MLKVPDPFFRFRRFTIKRLMIVVAVVAVLLALFQAGTFSTIIFLYLLALAGMAWLPSRGRARLAIRGLIVSAAWLNLTLPVFFAFEPVLHKWMLLFLSSLVCIPIVPGFGLAWVASREGWAPRSRAALVVISLTAIPVATILTKWPLRLAFYLSSPALNRLADRLEAGGSVGPDEWAGIYRIKGSTTLGYGGGTLLIVDPTRGDLSGFARRPGSAGGPRRESLLPGGDPSERWHYNDED